VALLLQPNGHSVTVEHDGADALPHAAGTAPDIMLIHIGMPGMERYTLARRLRELLQTAGAMLIAIADDGQAEERQRA
jgi:CheY-like chemotaxis protein